MNTNFKQKTIVLAGFLASMSLLPAAQAQTKPGTGKPATATVTTTATPKAPAPSSAHVAVHRTMNAEMPPKARQYYAATWGVDLRPIRLVSSGLMLRFSYLVMDENRAKVLSDKKFTPVLIDLKSGTRLAVPTLEKVGQLRQSSTPEKGREYWMVFSNSGTLVKPGDKVDVVIGSFRASGLTVE